MQAEWIFEIWGGGNFNETITLNIDPHKVHQAETYLTKKNGSKYGHAYIASVCTQSSSDVVLCGLNDEPTAPSVAYIEHGVRVTFGLRSKGGSHRSAGSIFSL